MKKYIILVFLVIIPLCKAEIIITEIMYHPIESDNYNEYLEIYNSGNESINLTNYTICGSKLFPGYINKTDSLIYLNSSLELLPYSYALITDGGSGTEVYDNFNVSNSSLALHVSSSSICGSLSNSGETIFLNNNSLNYSSEFGANGDGNSLQLFNNTWISSLPTPGYAIKNITEVINKTVNITNVSNQNELNQTLINESNITVENTTQIDELEDNQSVECDVGIQIYSDELLYSKEKSTYYLYLSSNREDQNAIVKYWIEDVFGNYLRKPRETTLNSGKNKSRSFTPPEIYSSEGYFIKAEIINASCDSNLSNNQAEFLIVVKGLEREPPKEVKENKPKEEITLEILNFSYEIKQGDNLTIQIKLRNPTNQSKKVYVSSYVYHEQQLASEGGWSANKQLINLSRNKTLILNLTNKIKENAEPTFWNLKVKAKIGNKTIESKDEVKIIEKPQELNQTIKETNNIIKRVNQSEQEPQLTGATVYEAEDNINYVKYFLILLFLLIIVVVLKDSKKNNFLKRMKLSKSNGKSRNCSKDKRRSSKSKYNN